MITNEAGTNYFTQWDTNQEVILTEEHSTCSHVHFKNPNSNTAYRVKVVDSRARIPDELFQTTENITAWVYDETESRTVATREFYVRSKQKPGNYEFTPTDAEVYQTLNERVENVEAQAVATTMAVKGVDARVTSMEKVIDVVDTVSPLPADEATRATIKLLAVRDDGTGMDPSGCNVSLADLLKAEVTQQELDDAVAAQRIVDDEQNALIGTKANQKDLETGLAAKADITALTAGLAGKADNAAMTDALNSKVDQDAQDIVDAAQNTEIAKRVKQDIYTRDMDAQARKNEELTNAISEKLDASTYTTDKQAQDALIASKADGVQVEQAFALKADKSETYTKDEVNMLLRSNLIDAEVYGVDFNMVTGEAKRIDGSVGLEFHRFVGGAGSTPIPAAKSFMNVGPWSNIYQTLRTVDGNQLVSRTGLGDFEEVLRSGECNLFTCIPKYFIKMETPVLNGQAHWILHVSAKPFSGAFSVIEGDSVEIASIVTGERNGKHVSQPGLIPKVSTAAYTFENKAEAQGLYNNSWNDFLSWWILMLVQTASLNSQNTVAQGCSSTLASWGGDLIKVVEARSNSNEIVMGKWSNYAPGMTVYINRAASSWYGGGLGIRQITNVAIHPTNPNWMVLTVDGAPLTTEVGDWCSGCGQITDVEAILDMGLDCGYWKPSESATESICHAFVYGICDPWANVFQATSGMCKENDKLYVARGRQKQPNSLPSETWLEADDFAWIGEGWPSEWRIQQFENTITMVPTKLGGSNAKLFGDYLWGAATDRRSPWRGGSSDNGSYDGACSVSWRTAGIGDFNCGARLTYQKAS